MKIIEVGEDKDNVSIKFIAGCNIRVNDMVCTEYQDKKRYFLVTEVVANGDFDLQCTAINYGYRNKIKKNHGIDLRNIVRSCEVELVENQDIIDTIRREAYYC